MDRQNSFLCENIGIGSLNYEELLKHKEWADKICAKYADINADNVMDILKEEIGQVFVGVLEDAGVYKCTEEGRAAFDRFVAVL